MPQHLHILTDLPLGNHVSGQYRPAGVSGPSGEGNQRRMHPAVSVSRRRGLEGYKGKNWGHTGPPSVGRNQPTMEVTIQITTAMIRDLIQPMVYSLCNASSHTIPAMSAASNPPRK